MEWGGGAGAAGAAQRTVFWYAKGDKKMHKLVNLYKNTNLATGSLIHAEKFIQLSLFY